MEKKIYVVINWKNGRRDIIFSPNMAWARTEKEEYEDMTRDNDKILGVELRYVEVI